MNKVAALFIVALCAAVTAKEYDVVALINSAQSTWQASDNEISDKGTEFVKSLLGTKFPSSKDIVNRRYVEIEKNIPTSFDARSQWPECNSISSIKNQGQCGSCWAVAAASAASDRLCIKSNFKVRVNISAENLLACCSDCVEDGGCNGGYPDKAWNYLKKTGLVTGGDYNSKEGCQPYEIAPTSDAEDMYTPPCHKKCTNKKYGTSFYKDKHYGQTSYYLAQDVSAIQSDIMKNGPVEAAFEVYSDFMYYTSGIYVRTSSDLLGGHAVRVLGWGVENGVKYWLVANSWGREWGENGTFRIRRGTNECSFEEYITAGLMKK